MSFPDFFGAKNVVASKLRMDQNEWMGLLIMTGNKWEQLGSDRVEAPIIYMYIYIYMYIHMCIYIYTYMILCIYVNDNNIHRIFKNMLDTALAAPQFSFDDDAEKGGWEVVLFRGNLVAWISQGRPNKK